jgi:hypothetical protein
VQPFLPDGSRYLVSNQGGEDPFWSADGKKIFYRQDQRLLAASLTFGPAGLVVAKRELLIQADLTSSPGHANHHMYSDGRTLVMLRSIGGQVQPVLAYNWVKEFRRRVHGYPR